MGEQDGRHLSEVRDVVANLGIRGITEVLDQLYDLIPYSFSAGADPENMVEILGDTHITTLAIRSKDIAIGLFDTCRSKSDAMPEGTSDKDLPETFVGPFQTATKVGSNLLLRKRLRRFSGL